MTRFHAKDSLFWLDDQPILVNAGEFHYFRTPADQWGHRLGLLKDAGFNALATYIPWLWHQPEESIVDCDGHTHPMRDLAGYLDMAAEMGFWLIPRPGPYIMAETINEGIPPWVFRKYPQAAFISQDGKTQNVASYLQPDFLACVSQWYQAVFSVLAPRQVTRGGKIIMAQLDNEMGMIQWVRNIMDLNPDTLARFAVYLAETYGKNLPSPYPQSELVDFLKDQISNPQGQEGWKIVEDYRRFYRKYLREYASWLWAEAKNCGMEVLPVINIHGFGNGGKTFPIGLSQLIDVMEIPGVVSATDVYPLHIGEGNLHHILMVNEMTRALHNPQQTLFSIEFQSGGVDDFSNGQASLFDLHHRVSLSIGMRAINHYLFTDGENHPILSPVKRHDWGHAVRKDGTLRSHYHRYPKLSRVLKTYGNDLTLARPQTVTTVGFLLDDYMTEYNNPLTQDASNILALQRDVILFDFIARGLTVTQRPFNAIEISRAKLHPAETPLLWVMMEKMCDADTQQKLVDYVQEGGKLVLAGRMFAEDFHHQPCTLLRDVIGIQQVQDDPAFTHSTIKAFQYEDTPVSFVETYTGTFAEVFATRGNGEVVGFVQPVGKGKVLVFGAAMTANTLDDIDIFHQMALKMGCPPMFQTSTWADVRINRGERGSFLFVHNFQDDPVETVISMEGQTLFGGNPVCLPARTGAILPLEWQVKEGVRINYATSEIIDCTDDGSTIRLKTAQDRFAVEMTLVGYTCEGAEQVRVQGKDGVILLQKASEF